MPASLLASQKNENVLEWGWTNECMDGGFGMICSCLRPILTLTLYNVLCLGYGMIDVLPM